MDVTRHKFGLPASPDQYLIHHQNHHFCKTYINKSKTNSMKTSIFILLICFTLQTSAQKIDATTEKILETYRLELNPYLEEMAKRESEAYKDPSIKEEPGDARALNNLIDARTMLLKSESTYVANKITQMVRDKKIDTSNKDIVARIIESEYRNQFPGLPKKYFEDAREKVSKL